MDNYEPIVAERCRSLLSNIYEVSARAEGEPISVKQIIEHYTMTTILTITFGNICSFNPGDPKLHEVFEVTQQAAAIFGPDQQLCEFFPILRPLLNNRKWFLEIQRRHSNFYRDLYAEFNRQTDPEDCFVKDIAAKKELTDMQITDLIAVFVGAGKITSFTLNQG